MSFGVSISDFHLILKSTKEIIHNCRYAPSEFAEVERASQSFRRVLEGVESEFEKSDSPLRKDENIASDFRVHLENCKASLVPLADITARYKSLATSNKRFIDRVRFSKKECLEYRGNLVYYTTQLSEFLQTVGLCSLGRIERKVDGISGSLPELMAKIDQLFAEVRLQDDEGSVFSDHTDDDKVVWKAFRSKLNDAGFTSQVLRDHEAAIFLRIRELNEFGLLDASAAPSICSDEGTPYLNAGSKAFLRNEAIERLGLCHETPIRLGTSGAEANDAVKNGSPGHNTRKRRPTGSSSGMSDNRMAKNESSVRSSGSSQIQDQITSLSDRFSVRLWQNPAGRVIEKGTFLRKYDANNQTLVLIADLKSQEVSIPLHNLSEPDRAYVKKATEVIAEQPKKEDGLKVNRKQCPSGQENNSDFLSKSNEETIELPSRIHPGYLTGARTKPKISWKYRRFDDEIPLHIEIRSRTSLTSDALPSAAAQGDLDRVKSLLMSGEHIESTGPKSWTETVTWTDGDGNTHSSDKRHSYPETTALYRAAKAGWMDVAHLLLRLGADANAQDGYDGKVGEPILFNVISNGNEGQARMLLEYGARVTRCGTRSPLHVASAQPRLGLVRLVLNYGAMIDAKDSDGRTALYLATCKFFPKNVQMLLQEGANPNLLTAEGRTALYKAAGNARPDIVRLLVQYRADPTLGRGRRGETLMYKAAWLNDLETIDLLLEFKADANLANDRKMGKYNGLGEMVLHGILGGLSKEHSFMNAWGRTALHAAAYRGHTDLVEMLLEGGADIEATGTDGQTALYLAASQEHDRTMQVLLDNGAKLETEKHDPVLARIQARTEKRKLGSAQAEKKRPRETEMAKIGSGNPLVGLVATIAKEWASSR